MTLSGVAEEGRAALGRSLLERKVLTSDWLPAFTAVPRTEFLPELIWPFDMDTGVTVAVDLRDEPSLWFSYAHADVPILTQWDDGARQGRGQVPTSSASMPSVVFSMLRDLDVQPGQRILEIGTGTGWNAALLAHRVGGRDNVVSLEVDAGVAAAARDRLARVDAGVLVISRDGEHGDQPGAPYDRIIATAGVRRIPSAWISDVRPGGLILAPWGTHFTNMDAVARLTVAEDGRRGEGRFTRPVEFMKLRGQRSLFAGHEVYVTDGVEAADRSTTTVTEPELLGEGRFAAGPFAVGLRVRDCHHQAAEKRDGARPVWFYGLTDRSWACVMFTDGQPEAQVWQSGPRRLWDEVAAALAWWRAADEPGFERFGLTATATGQQAWLDRPADAWDI
ncbi:protein-L-isoaspartate(D-aspartate) O-methyltransferase [Streptomyces phaeoluteigriseus]|uniref:Protein-L-isoaspartate O-methyltransferase n=1 Tax=Streptomyces phaeoluteigriseus TaxID=114686 RepID=A0A1V6MHX9_9ACTN|nr:methyltransferase domain-containing protein [Streptomyces phaeoluteigriseus]OQD51892.1 protein-L-isoaspartate(D-aspartate) O-methyltransferase [Streptomyces phaeoluteigriseus]